ncbi:MAG: 5'-methylthioadenosine/adenosylhomocysteine nucleosidase [Clostridia bacterium]|nr:5'-methylthioadenosine/adenosylhomocysteine nucleosidase [Clostridia bacterium]
MQNKGVIGIIGAMQIEVEALWAEMENKSTEIHSGITFVSGQLYGRRLVVAKCGIGKVFAAICAQTMIMKYAPDVIINSGVGGTMTDKLTIGDIALSEYAVQHDMDTTPLGDPAGLVSGINKVYFEADKKVLSDIERCIDETGTQSVRGIIATGDVFLDDSDRKAEIHRLFDLPDSKCIACEMEGGAIAQTCYVNGTPFCILRAISDGGDENSAMDYPQFLEMAAGKVTKILKRYIKGT